MHMADFVLPGLTLYCQGRLCTARGDFVLQGPTLYCKGWLCIARADFETTRSVCLSVRLSVCLCLSASAIYVCTHHDKCLYICVCMYLLICVSEHVCKYLTMSVWKKSRWNTPVRIHPALLTVPKIYKASIRFAMQLSILWHTATNVCRVLCAQALIRQCKTAKK